MKHVATEILPVLNSAVTRAARGVKGQPEDRWQANHVENESLEGECRGVDGG